MPHTDGDLAFAGEAQCVFFWFVITVVGQKFIPYIAEFKQART